MWTSPRALVFQFVNSDRLHIGTWLFGETILQKQAWHDMKNTLTLGQFHEKQQEPRSMPCGLHAGHCFSGVFKGTQQFSVRCHLAEILSAVERHEDLSKMTGCPNITHLQINGGGMNEEGATPDIPIAVLVSGYL